MSWQAYVDTQLMIPLSHGSTLQSGAICGLDGGVWAHSAAFPPVTTEQLLSLAHALTDDHAFDELSGTGFFLGNTNVPDDKYRIVPSEKGEVIRAKSKEGGCTVRKTNTAMVIGVYHALNADGKPAGTPYALANDCNEVVEKLGKYLIDYGY